MTTSSHGAGVVDVFEGDSNDDGVEFFADEESSDEAGASPRTPYRLRAREKIVAGESTSGFSMFLEDPESDS